MCGILLLLRLAGVKSPQIIEAGEHSDPLQAYLQNPYGVTPSQPHQSFWQSHVTVSEEMISASAIVRNMSLRGPDLVQGLSLELCPITGKVLKRVALGGKSDQLEVQQLQSALDEFRADSESPVVKSLLVSSVLSLRPEADGSASPQPIELNSGWFMYNGEVYSHESWDGHGPDTPKFAELVLQNNGDLKEIGRRTATCVGEFTWITLQYLKNEYQNGWNLNWAKDPIGRRSLLLGKLNNCKGVILGSVNMLAFDHLSQPLHSVIPPELDFSVPRKEFADEIVNTGLSDSKPKVSTVPDCAKQQKVKLSKEEKAALHAKTNSKAIKNMKDSQASSSQHVDADELEETLEEKYLANYNTAKSSYLIEVPSNHLFSLRIDPQLSALQVQAVLVDTEYHQLLTDCNFATAVADLQPEAREALIASTKAAIVQRLETSVGRILDSLPPPLPDRPTAAVLFSGGLDSTLVAHLCQRRLPAEGSLLLKSVAFTPQAADKLTARSSWTQLAELHADRPPVLLEVCPESAAASEWEKTAYETVYPQTSHLDVNIGRVLREAAGGKGCVFTGTNKAKLSEIETAPQPATEGGEVRDTTVNEAAARCRLVLCGQGADELFGGYRRYKQAFRRGGAAELKREMRFDLGRLWVRNLGRDDRAIGSTSKEARFPFLDLDLVKSVLKIEHPEILVGFGVKETTIGEKATGVTAEPEEKQLLRSIARDLGLTLAASYAKKAMQFGTGAAKASNISKFGSNRAARGAAKYSLE